MVTKRNRKRKRSKKSPRFKLPAINWLRMLSTAGVAVCLVGTYQLTRWLMDRPIEAVVVKGVFQRVSAVQLEEVLSSYVETGFLSADISAMQKELTHIPWIATADVRRRWPASIEVFVEEQSAAAAWGESGLLNIHGDQFVQDATHLPAELPRLSGPEGAETVVARRYFQVQKQLEQRGLSARSMTLDERGAWVFELSNGIRVRIGATDIDRRLERFFLVLDQGMGAGPEEVDYIDMRYTNGFAIGWKSEKAGPHA